LPIEQVSSNADAANRAWCVKGTHTFTSWGQLDPRPAPFLYSRGTLRSDAAVTIAAKRDVRPEAAATGAASHASANKHNASLSPPCRQYQCLILKAINFAIMRLTDGGLAVANSCANTPPRPHPRHDLPLAPYAQAGSEGSEGSGGQRLGETVRGHLCRRCVVE